MRLSVAWLESAHDPNGSRFARAMTGQRTEAACSSSTSEPRWRTNTHQRSTAGTAGGSRIACSSTALPPAANSEWYRAPDHASARAGGTVACKHCDGED